MTIDELMEDSPFTFRQRDAQEALANQPKPMPQYQAELKRAHDNRYRKKPVSMGITGVKNHPNAQPR